MSAEWELGILYFLWWQFLRNVYIVSTQPQIAPSLYQHVDQWCSWFKMPIKACSMVLPLHGGWTGFFWVKMVLLKSDQSFVEGSDDNCLMHSSHVLLRKAWSFCTYFVKGNNVCEFHFTSSLFCAAVVEIKSHHHSFCTSWKSVTFCAKSRSVNQSFRFCKLTKLQ